MNAQGHGLGLYISQRIANQLGGKIEVKSEYGMGSTFTVWLPSGFTDPKSLKP
jgi:signal transduction histidine kinase